MPSKSRSALQHGTPEYLERASGVVDAVMGKHIPHTVGDSGRQFLHQAILPLLPPSAHEIVGISIGEEFQDVFAVLLKVAVYLDDNVAERLIEARFERTGLAIISIEVEDPHSRMLRRQTIQGLAAAVAAAVVHEDDFEGEPSRPRVNSSQPSSRSIRGTRLSRSSLIGTMTEAHGWDGTAMRGRYS